MELMAPAGSVEHFSAALEAGADAVYVGAPFLNARNPARELRFEEIAAMVDHARSHDKRVYVALNSLVKEEDFAQLAETLCYLQAINPHGLIVQDLGVIDVIRRHFNTLEIHASTLLFAHSIIDVEMLAALGCSRVVLARELTLKEIEAVVRASPVEIEVFVHGAMCFSYSGRCLFSSYHGGKSGLRGNCVQPCRRKYSVGPGTASAKGRKAGERSGYLFSMNDLEGIDFIEDFKRIGVASIKIEGRLKPVTYVRNVVQAYRMVIDADKSDRAAALTDARELLEASLGRKRSTGYFLAPAPKDAITAGHSGNIGTYLGGVKGHVDEDGLLWGILVSREAPCEGDRLRLHFEKSGERTAFTARRVEPMEKGRTAVLLPDNLGRKHLQGRIDVYRVDTVRKTGHAPDTMAQPITVVPFSTRAADSIRKRSRSVLHGLAGTGKTTRSDQRGARRQSKTTELWLRLDTAGPIYQKLPFAADRYIIPIHKKTLAETGHLSRYFGKNRNTVIWALPPVVHTRKAAALQRDVNVLIRSGFRSFQISTLGQLGLFAEKNISLFGDFSLNVLNSATMRVMTDLGLKGFQFSIETDRNALKRAIGGFRAHMVQHDSGRPGYKHQNGLVGMTVYGIPPLFMSRVHTQNVSFKQKITSPRGEHFVVQKIGGETFTRPVKPFSLLPFMKELQTIGLDYMVIDLSGMAQGKKEMEDLARRIGGKERTSRLSSFNFDGKLE